MITEEDDHANQIQEITERKESSFLHVEAEIAEKQAADKEGE